MKNLINFEKISCTLLIISVVFNIFAGFYLYNIKHKYSNLAEEYSILRKKYELAKKETEKIKNMYDLLSKQISHEQFKKAFKNVINPYTGKPLQFGESVSFNTDVFDYKTPYQQRQDYLKYRSEHNENVNPISE